MRIVLSLVLSVTALTVSGCLMETDDVGAASQGVQQGFAPGGYVLKDSMPVVAAIRHVQSKKHPDTGEILRSATCGATFLSEHFAVTAAHCVEGVGEGPFTEAGEFFVEEIDTTDVASGVAESEGQVTGTYPDWTTGISSDPPAGYDLLRYRCRVFCSRDPFPTPCYTDSFHTQDIALIECPDRNAPDSYAVVHADEQDGDEVDVWWLHEYLELPTAPTASARWERYGELADWEDPDGAVDSDDNFHYDWEHLLWLLRGNKNKGGDNATVTETDPIYTPSLFDTDLFGCHGTSGSGVFGRGSTGVYGPVKGPAQGAGFPSDRLCGWGISPVKAQYTRKLEDRDEVIDDRNGMYSASF